MNYFGYIEGVYGVKTGFTGNAGRCLVSACNKENLDIIVVILGAGTKKQRTIDSINLINYTYKNFEMYDFKPFIDNNFSNFLNTYSNYISISKSTTIPQFVVSEAETYIFPIKKIYSEKINCSIYTLKTLEAPIYIQSKVGILQVSVNDEAILNLDILLENNLEKKDFKKYFIEILKEISINTNL